MRTIIDQKFWKFIAIGVLNTLIGTGVMFGLYNLLHCSYWISSAANYFVGSIFSYLMNKKFTFQHKGNSWQSALRFVLNIAGCYLVAYGLAKPLMAAIFSSMSLTMQENLAMLAGMCIFTGLNYLGQRFFVFPEEIS